MIPPPADHSVQQKYRSSFRRRLVLSQGLGLLIAFILLGIVGWIATDGWLHYHAWSVLHDEADEIAFHMMGPEGTLDVYRYAWHEPHHIHLEHRVDPFFVQVFDIDQKLLHESGNINLFPAGVYPDHLLHSTSFTEERFKSLRTMQAGDATLYYNVYPITNKRNESLGYLQIARYEPGIDIILKQTAIGLFFALGTLLCGLLLLTNWVASRTLAPLQAITRATHELSPAKLNQRIPLPDNADQETWRLAETLNQLLGRIETSFDEMKRFTSNAAHELQTPLTVLQGHVEVALRRTRSVTSYKDTLKLLGHEVEDMSKMVRNLLVLARLDRDQFKAQRTPVLLNDIVEASITYHQERASQAGLRIDFDLSAAVLLEGNAGLLREAIDNVLNNAIKYTTEGSIHVSLKLSSKSGDAVLGIRDTGIGISADALPHLTDRFYRAETVQGSGIPGSGLGLSIVAQIMNYHQGRLAITPVAPQGTNVQMFFTRNIMHVTGSTSNNNTSTNDSMPAKMTNVAS